MCFYGISTYQKDETDEMYGPNLVDEFVQMNVLEKMLIFLLVRVENAVVGFILPFDEKKHYAASKVEQIMPLDGYKSRRQIIRALFIDFFMRLILKFRILIIIFEIIVLRFEKEVGH